MPAFLLAAYIGFAGLSLGVLALLLHLYSRPQPGRQLTNLMIFLLLSALLIVAPLVAMRVSPAAKAALTMPVQTQVEKQNVTQTQEQ